MNTLTLFATVGIGIAGFLGGLIGYVILSPTPWDHKNQWLKKSLLSSYTGMLGLFVLVLAMNATYLLHELRADDFRAVLELVGTILAYVFPGGLILSVGTYLKTLMGGTRDKMFQQLKNRDHKKE